MIASSNLKAIQMPAKTPPAANPPKTVNTILRQERPVVKDCITESARSGLTASMRIEDPITTTGAQRFLPVEVKSTRNVVAKIEAAKSSTFSRIPTNRGKPLPSILIASDHIVEYSGRKSEQNRITGKRE